MPRVRQRTRIKICGVTRPEDALRACQLGADAIGLNFYAPSRRYIAPEKAREIAQAIPAFVDVVGVFVGASVLEIRAIATNVGLTSVQLHHREPPEMVRELSPWRTSRAFGWESAESAGVIDEYLANCAALGRLPTSVLIDTHAASVSGGTGKTWSWGDLGSWRPQVPMILAGGLKAENVAEAVMLLRPYAVDVAGGVESAPGIKDAAMMERFFEAVSGADRDI